MYHETHQQTPIKKKHPEKYWRILPLVWRQAVINHFLLIRSLQSDAKTFYYPTVLGSIRVILVYLKQNSKSYEVIHILVVLFDWLGTSCK